MYILKFILIIFFLTFMSVYSRENIEININVRNDIGNTMAYNTSFGISPLASDVLDSDLGEKLMPPPPFVGFYAVFEFIDSTQVLQDGSKYYDRIWTNKDIRYYPDTTDYLHVRHRMIFRFGSGEKMIMNWNKNSISDKIDSIFIRDRFNGMVINYNMKSVETMEWTNQDIRDLNIDVYYNFRNTSLRDNITNKVEIFPNPSSNVVNIKCDYDITKVEIIDINGAILISTSQTELIDISHLTVGTYFVNLYKSEQTIIHKIVKN